MGKTAKWFTDWLASNDVSYFKYTSRNVAGEETFDASSNLPCYLDETIIQLINYSNEEVVSDAHLFINGSHALVAGITVNDKFVLPDGENRYVQKIRKYHDETGAMDYLIVYL